MVELSNFADEFLEEILEVLWVKLEEEGAQSVAREEIVIGSSAVYEESIAVLEKRGLVTVQGEQIQLTELGFDEARRTIRRHRLSERMFVDIFEIKEEEIEGVACRFEHMLIRPELEEKICELLGHPRSCPHGRAIPVGECCHRAETRVDQRVVPMSNLRQGEKGAIAYVHTGDSEKLKKLMALGILPGESVTLQRRYPSFVFTVGRSRYAVDSGLAEAIYVKRLSPEEGKSH
ncbi:MAG: metal-dependent transcriptional regulator [Pseudomonadota bacterium]|jgi:DtxR family Mn-dependent transcriptional regulator